MAFFYALLTLLPTDELTVIDGTTVAIVPITLLSAIAFVQPVTGFVAITVKLPVATLSIADYDLVTGGVW